MDPLDAVLENVSYLWMYLPWSWFSSWSWAFLISSSYYSSNWSWACLPDWHNLDESRSSAKSMGDINKSTTMEWSRIPGKWVFNLQSRLSRLLWKPEDVTLVNLSIKTVSRGRFFPGLSTCTWMSIKIQWGTSLDRSGPLGDLPSFGYWACAIRSRWLWTVGYPKQETSYLYLYEIQAVNL